MNTPLKNFAECIVSGTYVAGATSIAVNTGHGSRLPDTATEGAYNAVWWNFTDYPNAAHDPFVEIIRVSVRSGDSLSTIVRGQEGTSASDKNIAGKEYRLMAGLTAGVVAELRRRALTQTARGLWLTTHPDADLALSHVVLNADAIVLSDGEEVSGWTNVVANLAASGAGGIDTGSEQSDTWYDVYAIYNGTTKSLCFHRCKNYLLDEDLSASITEDATQGVRSAVDNSTIKVAQGFQLDVAGPVPFIDVKLLKVGSPVGNAWYTLEGNSGGVPSNTPLSTSVKRNVSRLPTTATWTRMPFPSPASLSVATPYHLVAQGDWTVNASNYAGWRMDGSAAGYSRGSKSLYDSDVPTWTTDTDDDLLARIYVTENDVPFASTVPAGYQYAHVGYAYNNGAGHLVPFIQRGRKWELRNAGADGLIINETASGLSLVDLRGFVPAMASLTVYLALTGTGAAVASASVGLLDATDLANASLPGLQGALYAGGTAEWPYSGFRPFAAEFAGVMISPTAGADLYFSGFDW